MSLTLNNPQKFAKPAEISKEKLDKAIKAACDRLAKLIPAFEQAFPGTCSQDFKYVPGENRNWECGMFTGCFWLAYLLSGDEKFKKVAEKHLDTYKWRLDEKIGLNDHDVGFVFTPSCVGGWKACGNEYAKELAIKGAEEMFAHYTPVGKYILHTGYPGGLTSWRIIVDTMMNAPILFWAGKELGREEYTKAAVDHCYKTIENIVREDGSTWHHFQFEAETFKPLHPYSGQGYSLEGCWSRGNSWGVYGFPIAYSYTKNEDFKKVHEKISSYYLNHLPEDYVPYWDFFFTDGSGEERDASAGAIAVCGFNEMAKHIEDGETKTVYENAATLILNSLIEKYANYDNDNADGVLLEVTHTKPGKQGVGECAVYGDYFYFEALARYTLKDFKMFW